MTIGELLKEERLAKSKTQKEWVGNIISTSYYAKVEKNKHSKKYCRRFASTVAPQSH